MYRVELVNRARKDLRALSNPLYDRIRVALLSLATNPFKPGHIKLTEYENRYRIRVGDWRILYSIDDQTRMVTVHRIAHLSDAYE